MEDPLGSEAADFDEKFVEGSGGWCLRTLVWTPKVMDDAANRPVVVIPDGPLWLKVGFLC